MFQRIKLSPLTLGHAINPSNTSLLQADLTCRKCYYSARAHLLDRVITEEMQNGQHAKKKREET